MQNLIPVKFEILFFLIFDQSMILIPVYCTSTGNHEIRVSVTYLITITSINNRKTDIQWDFHFFLLKIAKLNTCERFYNHQMAKLNTCKM